MTRVQVAPALFRWACERANLSTLEATQRFSKFEEWLSGETQPTFKQLEKFAEKTHTPLGYFFLPTPPDEPLPIADFRTLGRDVVRPSADLLDTIYTMQRRQGWLRQERRDLEEEPLDFVGSARLSDEPDAIGQEMRLALGIDARWSTSMRTWTEAVGELRRRIEQLGVMAVINGVVGNSTKRKLDVEEFRGFALIDPYAPAIFVNGADAKSAQMFTLAHELAHIWLGRGGLSGFEGIFPSGHPSGGRDGGPVERFCDRAAAELLVPAIELKREWPSVRSADNAFEQLARHFKVSPIVAARRAMDLALISRETFFRFYEAYTQRERKRVQGARGGDFYRTQNSRLGERFAITVMRAALEGRVSFKEAYSLTGLNGGTFQEYGQRLGVPLHVGKTLEPA